MYQQLAVNSKITELFYFKSFCTQKSRLFYYFRQGSSSWHEFKIIKKVFEMGSMKSFSQFVRFLVLSKRTEKHSETLFRYIKTTMIAWGPVRVEYFIAFSSICLWDYVLTMAFSFILKFLSCLPIKYVC